MTSQYTFHIVCISTQGGEESLIYVYVIEIKHAKGVMNCNVQDLSGLWTNGIVLGLPESYNGKQ